MILFVEKKMKGIELYDEIRKYIDRFLIKEKKVENNSDNDESMISNETYFKLSIVSKLANSCGNSECKVEKCSGCEIKCSNDEIELENEMNISINWNSIDYFNQKEAMVFNYSI